MITAKGGILIDITYGSSDFDSAYDIFSQNIPAAFLEDREFLRDRLRVRDEGPKTEKERILVQEGYTLHLLAAKPDNDIVGGVYGHVISRVGSDNRAVGFVTYISVLRQYREKGIGTTLISELRKRLEEDSQRLTGKPLVGMLYEIEEEGKQEIKGLVRKLNGAPLDIAYSQPALHPSMSAEPMLLWFQPLDPKLASIEQTGSVTYPAEFIKSMVLNLLTMEYVGPEMKGFDPESRPYTEFVKSLGERKKIGFRI